jgi:hypothetical protein
MNTLNSYGYNDGDNGLLPLKMKQQAIDNAQDKKIDNLSKQSGGGGSQLLEIIIDPQNMGEHSDLTKEEAIQYLNVSESDFDKLMSGQYNQIIYGTNVESAQSSITMKANMPVFYVAAMLGGSVQQGVHAKVEVKEESAMGITCEYNGNEETYKVQLLLPVF